MRLVVFALLPALLAAGEAAVDPSGEEMALLEMANSHRTTRVLMDNRIGEMIRTRKVTASNQAWSHLPTKGKAQALVLNPALMTAARNLLKQGAKPEAGKPFDAVPAMREAGYVSDKGGVALFAADAPDLLTAYAAAMVTVIGTVNKNGTSPSDVLIAQDALKNQWREVGLAVSGAKGRTSLVIVLGQGAAKRYAGGVVYADADRDLAYDVGEGRSGITVTCGSASMTTGASGAWWLALDNEQEAVIAFSGGGSATSRTVAKGATSQTVSWRMPNPGDQKNADKLIADAEKVAAATDLEKKRPQLAALLLATRMAALDDDRQKKAATLVEPLLGEYELLQGKILEALGEEPADFKKTLGEAQKPWKSALAPWFKEAESLGKLRQQVNKVLAAPEDQRGKQAGPALKQVQKAKGESVDPKFLELYCTWEDQLLDCMPAEAAAPAKKK